MSNELATTQDNLVDSLIAKFTKEKGEGYPSVSWTEDAVTDKEGKVVKVKGKSKMKGVFEVTGYDGTLDTIKFKPLCVFYQYLKWNEAHDTVECQTIFFDDWRQEPIDTKGTIRCGRPAKKAFEQLESEEQKAWRKEVPAYMHTFGLVEIPDGEDILVDFKVSGGKFKAVGDAFKSIKGNAYYTHAFDFSLVKSTDHDGYDFAISEDTEYTLEDPSSVVEYIRDAVTYISERNSWITSEYNKALTGGEEDATLIEVVDTEVEVDGENPFD